MGIHTAAGGTTAPEKLALFLKPEQLMWQTKAAASENCERDVNNNWV